jgi:hypothetical protein
LEGLGKNRKDERKWTFDEYYRLISFVEQYLF